MVQPSALSPAAATPLRAPATASPALARAAIIIPARNAAATLDACLLALHECSLRGAEVILVDDRSTDDTVSMASRYAWVRCIPVTSGTCDGAGRNTGALATGRELLVFVDADVVVDAPEVERLLAHVDGGGWDASVGCYCEHHDDPGLVSQYKNLWIRLSYLAGPRELNWLWTACCAVRRDSFERAGGFNEQFTTSRGGVDFEMGSRMREAGMRILFDPGIECRHLKRFSLPGLLVNDYRRARSYCILAMTLRGRAPIGSGRFANVRISHFVSGVCAWGVLTGAVAGIFFEPALFATIYLGALWLVLQARFTMYFGSRRGFRNALAALPILFLDEAVSVAGSAAGAFQFLGGERSPGGPGLSSLVSPPA